MSGMFWGTQCTYQQCGVLAAAWYIHDPALRQLGIGVSALFCLIEP